MKRTLTAITLTTGALFVASLARHNTWWGPAILGIILIANIIALTATTRKQQ